MRGVAAANAAISVVNALPLGIGAAVGIEWGVTTTVVSGRTLGDPSADVEVTPGRSRTPLVRAAANASRVRYGEPSRPLRLRLRSTLPAAKGLKSSSAVASSVVWAVARACGHEPAPAEVARVSAAVGRATGVSATGAFDDALAGVSSRGVVTDNARDRCLRTFTVGGDLAAALWIPAGRHPPAPALKARFARNRRKARQAVELVMAGDWPGAMDVNSQLVEHVLGYRYGRLRERLLEAGAVAGSVSGLGPAFAAVASSRRISRVLAVFPRAKGHLRVVRFGGPVGVRLGGSS